MNLLFTEYTQILSNVKYVFRYDLVIVIFII
jgi:hypothetical protein